jgi:NAD-dependent protein deacetylase/lipoamidase
VCLDQSRTWIEQASAITVLTGAGISAESGIPTFRGAAGLWKDFRPEDLATPSAFSHDPKLVWEWYDWRRGLIQQAQPNPGHVALAQLEERSPRFTLITQNVDGLHHRAGSRNVLEVHGSIWTLRCTACSREWHDETVSLTSPPRCGCGALARPGVVWFGEALPPKTWATAEEATASCDVFLVVGTSALVYPAAGLIDLARASSAKIIEINTERTAISEAVDCALIGPAGAILPQLLSDSA